MDTYRSFVAVGDSFTEGMSDGLPDGSYRGWADLVAAELAGETDGFRYANLAVRGKLVGQILAEQVGAAAAMGGELVSFAGGMNDVMRPGCDMGAVCSRIERVVELLGAGGGRLMLFRAIDPSARIRGGTRLVPRVRRMIDLVDELAARHDAVLVDLFTTRVFDSPALWAEDRIHLNAEGHRRVAGAVLQALGRPSFDWTAPVPVVPVGWVAARRADARWLRMHAGPWIGRRLTGRSSGDGRPPKRPSLEPYAAG